MAPLVVLMDRTVPVTTTWMVDSLDGETLTAVGEVAGVDRISTFLEPHPTDAAIAAAALRQTSAAGSRRRRRGCWREIHRRRD
jgi:hypothetical protein